jgi:flagellar protein FlbD
LIQVTRLNSKGFAINADMIKFIEPAPDTVLTLVNGEKVIVRESVDEIVRRIVEFRRAVLAGISWPIAESTLAAVRSESATELAGTPAEGNDRG